jgi:hypothetical protein
MPPSNDEPQTPDPLEVEAAHIDVRSEEAPELIEELEEHAREEGKDVEG